MKGYEIAKELGVNASTVSIIIFLKAFIKKNNEAPNPKHPSKIILSN